MSDKSDIGLTLIVDREGRRVRTYRRRDPSRPGSQERRRMAALGLRWCRRCEGWLSADDVRSGLCRPHTNALAREIYAANPAMKEKKVARARGIEPLPLIAVEYLMEQFEGLCVYCRIAPATTWDHVTPVSRGGRTEPGNIVPACKPCNSSKRDRDVVEWARVRGFDLDALSELPVAA